MSYEAWCIHYMRDTVTLMTVALLALEKAHSRSRMLGVSD